MRKYLAWAVLLVSVASSWADDAVAKAQQTLRDQGYYYGEVTGEKDSVTTDAIRRYQIRNGLKITGELNDETLRSLKETAATAETKPAATAAPVEPAPAPDTSDVRDEAPADASGGRPVPAQPYVPPDTEHLPPNRGAPPPNREMAQGMFEATPYETAPPEVQRKVIADAQRLLARRGLFKSEIDGYFGPDLEFSLRAYQSGVGLKSTGRLDLETLAALQLLPGSHNSVVAPGRRMRPPGFEEPPVRGEWIRP